MEFRRATTSEAEAVADLWLRSRRASVPAIPPPVHGDGDVRAWFETVVLPEQEVWLAVDGEALVALMVLHDDWLEQLYVAPGRFGEGLGSRLVDLAKELRPAGLQLHTFASNAGARRFYEHHGFRATDASADNEERALAIRYEWPTALP